MNTPISRLFVVVLVLFAALVYSTSRWTIFDANALNHDHPDQNRRALVRGLTVKRGAIRADDNSVLAGSVKRADGTYVRRYPSGELFSHAVGYSFLTAAQSGLEAQYDDELRGKRNDAETLVDELRGRSSDGDRLITNLDPPSQRIALQELAGRKGSVVALDPRTGAVKVMASVPGFDPNDVRRTSTFEALQHDQDSPLFNRATQAGYPPGSTFKVVTAIAALDSGKFTPQSTLSGKSPITISGVPLANDGGEQFGEIDMTKALTNSVNTYFAQVGEKVGAKTMQRYMSRLGFCKKLPLDYPKPQIRPSGENIGKSHCAPATNGNVDVGRMAIGQHKLQVSPLQMAMVAAAVANGGKLMEPHLGAKIVDPDGRTKKTIDPQEYAQVMSPQTAQEVGEMMTHVVDEGTGTAAALEGIKVAGKTGTAEIGNVGANLTQPWFIAFAPVDNPRIAIAVTIERTVGGFGGTVAAPIAKDVMQTLLREGP